MVQFVLKVGSKNSDFFSKNPNFDFMKFGGNGHNPNFKPFPHQLTYFLLKIKIINKNIKHTISEWGFGVLG